MFDDEAITPSYEYIILIGTFLAWAVIFFATYASELSYTPAKIAMEAQFQDIGNAVSSKIVDIYIVMPKIKGHLNSKFYMPEDIGGYEYKVTFKESNQDQQVLVSALEFEKEILITLNGIGSSIALEGSTLSAAVEHYLSYNVQKYLMPTAVAVVHPRIAKVNRNITFDASYSKGEGALKYKWEFGDGATSTSPVVQHKYTATGSYNAVLIVTDSNGNSDTSNTTITVIASNPDPYLEVDKFVSPETFSLEEGTTTHIILYGGGIREAPRSTDVILATDISGSMDPDYFGYGDDAYTAFKSSTSKISSSQWNQTIIVDSTFKDLIVEARSINGTRDINLWLKDPNGNIGRAQYSIANGERYYVTNPIQGNWTIIVNGNFSQGSQEIKVNVNKTTLISQIPYSGTVAKYNWWINNSFFAINASKLRVELAWPGTAYNPNLDLHLTSPTGEKYGRGEITTGYSGDKNPEYIEVVNPADGNWTVRIYYRSGSGSGAFSGVFALYSSICIAEYFGNITSNAYTQSIITEDRLENFKIELKNLNGTKSLQMWISKNGAPAIQAIKTATGAKYVEANVNKDTTYQAYVTGDFPEGEQEFALSFYMAKIDAAKICGKLFTEYLNSTDQVGLVIFKGDGYYGTIPNVTLIQGLTYDKNAVKNGFDGLTAYGGTPTGQAIAVATYELTNKSPYFTAGDSTRLPAIILLSDGLPTLPQPESKAREQALDQASAAKAKGIAIYTIGFGVDADKELLQQIASTPSNFYYAATKEDLENIYRTIARELRETAATNLTVIDIIPSDIILDESSLPPETEIIHNEDGTTTLIWQIERIKIDEAWTREFNIKVRNENAKEVNIFNQSRVEFTSIAGTHEVRVFPHTYINITTLREEKIILE
ncbi:MAG: PKD domain-containing protein [Methanocellales archaeon]